MTLSARAALRPGAPAPVAVAALAAAVAGGLLVASGPVGALSGALAAAVLLVATDSRLLAAAVAIGVAAEPAAFGHADALARPVGLTAGGLALLALAGTRRSRLPLPLVAAGAGFGAWTLASWLWAADRGAALRSFEWWAVAAGAGLAVAVFARTPRALVRATAALGIAALAAALGSVAAAWLGAGAQPDRAYVGFLAGVALPLLLGAAAEQELPSARVAGAGAAAALVAVVGAAGTAAAVAPLAAGAAAALLLPRRRSGAAFLALAGGAAGATALSFLPSVAGAERRLLPGTPVWRLPAGHELLGAGAGAAATVHDAYLQTLAELGPVGLGLLGLTLLAAGWTTGAALRRLRGGELEPVAAGAFGALLAAVVGSFFLSTELARPLWLVVGVAAALGAVADLVRERELAEAAAAGAALCEERRRLELATAELDERAGSLDAEAERLLREQAEVARGRAELTRGVEEISRGLEEIAGGREQVARAGEELSREREQIRREREELRRHREELERLRGEVEARRAALEAEAAALAARGRSEPAPEPEAEAAVERGEAPTLVELERLVARADAPAERREEWEIYLRSLRDVATVDGGLPASLDALVREVFGELL